MRKIKITAALILAMILVFSVSVGAFTDATGSNATEQTAAETTGASDTQSANGNGQTQGNKWTSILMTVVPILILVAFFYFGIYRPQKKQEREKRQLLDSLAVGSDVVTIGGIMGRIVSIKDDSVIIESGSDKNKLQISKGAISTVNKPE